MSVSPNQRSLPGLHRFAHPLARYLNRVQFKESMSSASTARSDMDDPRGPSYRVPLSFNPEVTEHSLMAVAPSPRPKETVEGMPGRLAGELHWRGDRPFQRRQTYPGEITYVSRHHDATEDLYRDQEEGVWKSQHPFPRTPGLMTSMFQFAHQQVQPGQTTVPVHSPERSAEGEAWSAKVGPEHLRPKRGDDDWRPPYGTHPFEKAEIAEQEPRREYRVDVMGPTRQQHFFDAAQYDRDPF